MRGSLSYEMCAGIAPFCGDNLAAVSQAVIHGNPPRLSSMSPPLDRVVLRALEKRPEDRYQTTTDLLADLQRLKPVANLRSADRTSDENGSGRSRWLLLAAPIVAATVALGAWWVWRGAPAATTVSRPVQITSATGLQDFPSWSPDGRAIAYASDESGNNDIWVRSLGNAQAVNRTADNQLGDSMPSWSPDGQSIAFYSAREGGGWYLMSPFGGVPKRLLATGAPDTGTRPSPAQWSSDSSTVALLSFNQPQSIQIVSVATGESRRVALPNIRARTYLDIAWSPDARYFVYVIARDVSAQVSQLSLLRVADGHGTPLTDGRTNVQSPKWSPDGRAVYYTSNRGGSMDLWQQRIASDGSLVGEPTSVTSGVEIRRAAISPDGSRIAYARGRLISNIWTIPVLADRTATWADARQITFDEAQVEFVDLSPDGRRLLVSSDKAGNPDLWTMPAEGGEMERLTSEPTPDWRADFSPDGTQIGFYSYRSGNRDVWVMPAAGGPARQLTDNHADTIFSGWSPDGTQILYLSNVDGAYRMWAIPASGGTPRRISEMTGVNHPSWSPDGQSIVFPASVNGKTSLWQVPVGGGKATQLTRDYAWLPRWPLDGSRVFFPTNLSRPGGDNVWAVDPRTHVETQISDLTGRRGRLSLTALATDGRRVYFGWGEARAHVWVADLIRR